MLSEEDNEKGGRKCHRHHRPRILGITRIIPNNLCRAKKKDSD